VITGAPESDWAESPPFEPTAIFAALQEFGVEFVLIGGYAAQLHRAAVTTDDIDITPQATSANLERLAACLKHLDARLRAEGLPPGGMRIPLDKRTFRNMTTVTFITIHGPLDVALLPDGTSGYDDLIVNAGTVVAGALTFRLADLADIIRSKDAAGRAKDQAVLPELRRRLREVDVERHSAPPDARPKLRGSGRESG